MGPVLLTVHDVAGPDHVYVGGIDGFARLESDRAGFHGHIMKNRDCCMISIENWRMLTVNTGCAGIMEQAEAQYAGQDISRPPMTSS